MKKGLILLFLAAFAMWSCGSETDTKTEEEVATEETTDGEESTTETTEAGDGIHFGESITDEGVISYTQLLGQMEGKDSVSVKVAGMVEAVCQSKGCWMNIAGGEGQEEMFVQFEDYGFFMPKDIAGRKVVMQGKAYRDITSIEDLKHFAEDEGKTAEEIAAITEPVEEFKFLATGVLLLD